MLDQTELDKIIDAAGEHIVDILFGEGGEPADRMTLERARKVGEAYGLDDPIAGQLIAALAAYIVDRHAAAIIASSGDVMAAIAALPRDGEIQ